MKKISGLTIPVERITWEGYDVPVSLEADWFAQWLKEQPGLEFSPATPLTGNVHLERHDRSILVRGHLQGRLFFPCSRCLEVFAEPVEATFDLLLKIGSAPAAPPDVELSDNDLLEEYFQGDELKLDGILREQILLAVPLKPLCREDCLGLCRQCGSNLNQKPCSCSAPAKNSAFAALKKLQE